MIPEHIKKLLTSRLEKDQRIGLELARESRLVSLEFQIFLFHKSHLAADLIDEYIDRKYSDFKNLEAKPYIFFTYKE